MPHGGPPSGGACGPGMPATPGICPSPRSGDPYGSGSARSCSSRPRSPRSSPISSASCRPFRPSDSFGHRRPRSRPAPVGRPGLLPACGRLARGGPADRGQHGGVFPRDPDAVAGCRGSAAIRPGRFFPSPSMPGCRSSRPTQHACSAACWVSAATRLRAGQDLLWATAAAVLPLRDVGRFNQALMELGSQVCTPRAPRCGSVRPPLLCRARQQGWSADPAPKAKPAVDKSRQGRPRCPPQRPRAGGPTTGGRALGRPLGLPALCRHGHQAGPAREELRGPFANHGDRRPHRRAPDHAAPLGHALPHHAGLLQRRPRAEGGGPAMVPGLRWLRAERTVPNIPSRPPAASLARLLIQQH